MSGTPPVVRGSTHSDAPCSAVLLVRDSAAENAGLWVLGQLSELPRAKLDTVSTPALTKMSPSPALMACSAMRVVCTLDAQYLVTVVPGRLSYPASTDTTRPRLKP